MERERYRPRSRSRSRSPPRRRRSRSRSRSPQGYRDRRSRRATGFDQGPAPGGPGGPAPGGNPNPFPGARGGPSFGARPDPATRMARRLYLGSLPERVNEAALAEHLCMALKAVGGATTDRPVWHLYVNEGRKFGFAEFMTVEECSNTVALDGILFNGASIRIRRPNDYVPSEAQRMGPSMPSKALRLEVVGLQAGGFTRPEDDPDRIFVGGLPYDLLEGQFIDLLTSAGGPLRSHTYKKNPDTGLGAGYGFAVFVDPSSADAAITSLHGLRMGDKCLTCRRAAQGQRERQQQQQQQQFFSAPPPQIQQPIPTAVVRLNGCVTASELSDPNEYKEIYDDMLEEAERYGNVLKLHIPKPEGEASVPGLGKVYVRYADPSQSLRAFQAMNGRKFGGNTVVADFLDERKFDEGSIE